MAKKFRMAHEGKVWIEAVNLWRIVHGHARWTLEECEREFLMQTASMQAGWLKAGAKLRKHRSKPLAETDEKLARKARMETIAWLRVDGYSARQVARAMNTTRGEVDRIYAKVQRRNNEALKRKPATKSGEYRMTKADREWNNNRALDE